MRWASQTTLPIPWVPACRELVVLADELALQRDESLVHRLWIEAGLSSNVAHRGPEVSRLEKPHHCVKHWQIRLTHVSSNPALLVPPCDGSLSVPGLARIAGERRRYRSKRAIFSDINFPRS